MFNTFKSRGEEGKGGRGEGGRGEEEKRGRGEESQRMSFAKATKTNPLCSLCSRYLSGLSALRG